MTSRRWSTRAAAATAGLLMMLGAEPALAATVNGQVVMGTEGAEVPSDLQVMVLELPEEGQEPQNPTPATVADDASFTFEADENMDYVVGTFHASIPYSTFIPAGSTEPIELTIYETTNDSSAIRVASDSLTVVTGEEEGANVLDVLQLLRVENASDRTYVGEEGDESGRVLTLPVPESAFDLSPAEQADPHRLASNGGEVVTTAPLQPGVTSIPYLYRVEVPRSGWQLRREVLQPTVRADLLIGSGLVFEAGPGFEFAEETELGGQTYRRYRREDLSPGSVLAADIGFPGRSNTGLWVGAGIAAAVLVALLAAGEVLRRKRKKAARAARPARKKAPGATTESRDELIEQVARLDEEHAAGEISDDQHDEQRRRLLVEIEKASPGGQ